MLREKQRNPLNIHEKEVDTVKRLSKISLMHKAITLGLAVIMASAIPAAAAGHRASRAQGQADTEYTPAVDPAMGKATVAVDRMLVQRLEHAQALLRKGGSKQALVELQGVEKFGNPMELPADIAKHVAAAVKVLEKPSPHTKAAKRHVKALKPSPQIEAAKRHVAAAIQEAKADLAGTRHAQKRIKTEEKLGIGG